VLRIAIGNLGTTRDDVEQAWKLIGDTLSDGL